MFRVRHESRPEPLQGFLRPRLPSRHCLLLGRTMPLTGDEKRAYNRAYNQRRWEATRPDATYRRLERERMNTILAQRQLASPPPPAPAPPRPPLRLVPPPVRRSFAGLLDSSSDAPGPPTMRGERDDARGAAGVARSAPVVEGALHNSASVCPASLDFLARVSTAADSVGVPARTVPAITDCQTYASMAEFECALHDPAFERATRAYAEAIIARSREACSPYNVTKRLRGMADVFETNPDLIPIPPRGAATDHPTHAASDRTDDADVDRTVYMDSTSTNRPSATHDEGCEHAAKMAALVHAAEVVECALLGDEHTTDVEDHDTEGAARALVAVVENEDSEDGVRSSDPAATTPRNQPDDLSASNDESADVAVVNGDGDDETHDGDVDDDVDETTTKIELMTAIVRRGVLPSLIRRDGERPLHMKAQVAVHVEGLRLLQSLKSGKEGLTLHLPDRCVCKVRVWAPAVMYIVRSLGHISQMRRTYELLHGALCVRQGTRVGRTTFEWHDLTSAIALALRMAASETRPRNATDARRIGGSVWGGCRELVRPGYWLVWLAERSHTSFVRLCHMLAVDTPRDDWVLWARSAHAGDVEHVCQYLIVLAASRGELGGPELLAPHVEECREALAIDSPEQVGLGTYGELSELLYQVGRRDVTQLRALSNMSKSRSAYPSVAGAQVPARATQWKQRVIRSCFLNVTPLL